MAKKIRVVVVDDTLTSRQLLKFIVEHSGDMEIVGEGNNGEQALSLVRDMQPDVLLMDVVMPRMDGLEATRQIMRTTPVPIVLVSATVDPQETEIAFQALRAGALTLLQKPQGMDAADMSSLRTTIRAMSEVKVIHHYVPPKRETKVIRPEELPNNQPDVIAIASSTGGPAALSEIIANLPAMLPIPILIVQHISADFVSSLVDWLQTLSRLPIHVAQRGESPKAGHIYIAPGDAHLSINNNRLFELESKQGTWRYMPSCDVLLHSVAEAYGKRAIGIVLTGMGDDGADGLKAMYEVGAFTIAQDKETSVVYGMPQEAMLRGGAQQVLPIQKIAPAILQIVKEGAKL